MPHHEVEKFKARTRWLHWVVTLAALTLGLTGLFLYVPQFGGVAQDSYTRIIHRIDQRCAFTGVVLAHAIADEKEVEGDVHHHVAGVHHHEPPRAALLAQAGHGQGRERIEAQDHHQHHHRRSEIREADAVGDGLSEEHTRENEEQRDERLG